MQTYLALAKAVTESVCASLVIFFSGYLLFASSKDRCCTRWTLVWHVWTCCLQPFLTWI